ncbi:hypothetical protein KKE06_04580 [Candidatus Micrarchaeota archaeon]|nr:hypothetical protein [Candidatus Micrarchaeota archaeon]MBU1930541.1 hypothetical protein [Candidatus Micrarchaeota archaeon]
MEHPEASLVRKEWIVRKMDLPPEVKLTRRSLLRWFALSTGLISPKESRSTILDILDSLFFLLLSQNQNPTTLELQAFLKEKKNKTISEKLLLYHLKRLIDLDLLVRKRKHYYLNAAPNSPAGDFTATFNHWIAAQLNQTLQELENVSGQLAESYRNAK